MRRFTLLLLSIVVILVSVPAARTRAAGGQAPGEKPGRASMALAPLPEALKPTPTWSAEGEQPGAGLGTSVGAAGDVNGDGFGDLIVGEPNYNDPNLPDTNEGRALVYLGSAAGPSLDAAWTAGGVRAHFGAAVASAGDVNGDGFGDVLVGEPDAFLSEIPGSPPSFQGQVSLYLGSPSGLASAPALTLHDGNFARFGAAVASAGDVNGDGFSDVIIGAPGQNRIGQAFVYLGSPSGLSTTPAWSASGEPQNIAEFGHAVAGAGDVNGDGFGDVIVGEPFLPGPGGCPIGRAFVYFGSSQGLSTAPGWVMDGDGNCFNLNPSPFGSHVASAGDVDGDGYGDILVGGARFGTLLFHGSPAGPSHTPAWTGYGIAETAGDVDGDRYGDVVLGTSAYSNGQQAEGAIFIYLGSRTGLSANPALVLESDQAGANLGNAVGSAGDTDGDGRGNVIAGAYLYDGRRGADSGAAFLLFGPTVVGCVDADLDGYCATGLGADCDDTNPQIHPNAPELCNGLDDDCDGQIDEGFGVGIACTVGVGACMVSGATRCAADGSIFCDAPPPPAPTPEVCDGIDNNCNGLIDEEFDTDGDGAPDCSDNCPGLSNPTQADVDLDHVGDLCDDCPRTYDPGQADTDRNGFGDACDDPLLGSTITIDFKNGAGRGSGTVGWRTSHEADIAGFNVVEYTNRGDRIQVNGALIPCIECTTGSGFPYAFYVPKHKSARSIFVEEVHQDGRTQTFGPAVRQ